MRGYLGLRGYIDSVSHNGVCSLCVWRTNVSADPRSPTSLFSPRRPRLRLRRPVVARDHVRHHEHLPHLELHREVVREALEPLADAQQLDGARARRIREVLVRLAAPRLRRLEDEAAIISAVPEPSAACSFKSAPSAIKQSATTSARRPSRAASISGASIAVDCAPEKTRVFTAACRNS